MCSQPEGSTVVDYAGIITTAQTLITANGRSVTFVAFDTTEADSSKPWNGPADPRSSPDATLALDAVFVPPGGVADLGRVDEVDDLLKRAEQVLICSPGAAVDLTAYQEVLDSDNTRWKITGVKTLKPGGSIVLNYVGVRR